MRDPQIIASRSAGFQNQLWSVRFNFRLGIGKLYHCVNYRAPWLVFVNVAPSRAHSFTGRSKRCGSHNNLRIAYLWKSPCKFLRFHERTIFHDISRYFPQENGIHGISLPFLGDDNSSSLKISWSNRMPRTRQFSIRSCIKLKKILVLSLSPMYSTFIHFIQRNLHNFQSDLVVSRSKETPGLKSQGSAVNR